MHGLTAARPVLVVGAASEIDASVHQTLVRIAEPSPELADQAWIAAVVDTRHVEIRDAKNILAAANSEMPILLLSDSVAEQALQQLAATDVLVLPAPRTAIARRVRHVIELGVARHTAQRATAAREEIATLRSEVLRLQRTLAEERDATEGHRLIAERHRFHRLVAMGTMVAGFAHEVRNPVAALRSITEELAEELVAANVELPHAARMLKVLERIERLVRTSLQFGRPATPRRAAHRPWTLLSTAVTGVGNRLVSTGEELRIEVEPDLPDVWCDDAQIAQAIVVLIDNALDATGSIKRVLVRARSGRDDGWDRESASGPGSTEWVRFDVHDDGPGIDPDCLERVFDPFYTTKPKGTGLGLSIAQQLVADNGGRIELNSRTGGPTTFSILLPTARG